MTDLLQQKRRMNWYNQEKVNNMSFGDSEWPEVCKILDDPDIPKEVKEKTLDDYIAQLFNRAGVQNISLKNIRFKLFYTPISVVFIGFVREDLLTQFTLGERKAKRQNKLF